MPERVTRRRLLQKSSLFPYQPRERGNLPEEVLFWLGRTSEHLGARIEVRHQPRLRPDFRTAADKRLPSKML